MDYIKKCSKYKTIYFKSKSTTVKSTKDGLHPICKICRKGYLNENYDEKMNIRKIINKKVEQR